MKIGRIFIGVLCIVLAGILILDAVGITAPLKSSLGDISLLQMVVGVVLLAVAGICMIKGKWIPVVWLLAVEFTLFERNIAVLCGAPSEDLINNWITIGVAVLLTVGIACIRPRRIGYREGWESGGHSMASNTVYIDSATFEKRYQENNMGSTVIWFENADAYKGGGILRVENNMGSTVVKIPAQWSVDVQIENNMGAVRNEIAPGTVGPVVYIQGENNMGSIVIQRA